MAAKIGRPSKEGARYPSGKLKPAAAPSAIGAVKEITGEKWQRILAHAEKLCGDARLGTELGRLSALGQITSSEAATGFRVAGIYGRFEYYKNLRRSAASPSYIREYVAEGAGADTEMVNFGVGIEGRERDRSWMPAPREEREMESTAAFKDLQKAIPAEYCAQLEQLCVADQHVGYQGLIRARLGLSAARQYFVDKEKRRGKTKPAEPRRRVSGAPAAPADTPSVNPLKEAFFAVQRTISPHLNDEGLEHAWSVLCALKSRADFRQDKKRKLEGAQ